MCCTSYANIQLCASFTSFRLEVGDAVHDDMVKEQRLVVDLDLPGKQAAEVLNISTKFKIKVTQKSVLHYKLVLRLDFFQLKPLLCNVCFLKEWLHEKVHFVGQTATQQ